MEDYIKQAMEQAETEASLFVWQVQTKARELQVNEDWFFEQCLKYVNKLRKTTDK